MYGWDSKSLMRYELKNLHDTQQLGQGLGRSLPAGTVILLDGNLGSGKTSLVQGIGQGLGITDAIVSPTFTLVNEYPEGRIPLYHLDLYRLDAQAVAPLYIETYWEGDEYPPGIVAIEWPERLPYRPDRYLHLTLHITEGDRRLLDLRTVGPVVGNWLDTLRLEWQPAEVRSQ
jgi:tRNA threonylcarbamoyladenosine biosynthesis protein TsaE